MSSDYILIKTYDNNFEADLAKGLLEENGIPVKLNNEIFNSIYATFAGDMFHLELWVPEDLAETANELLEAGQDGFFAQKVLQETGALMEGHFQLTSGLHSDRYIEKIRILQNPQQASDLCKLLANHFATEEFEAVVGPAYGGIALAFEVARQLGKQFIFTQRKDEKMTIRSGFDISELKYAIVIEDIVTTGSSTKEVISCLQDLGIKVIGVGAIVDRSDGSVDFGCPFFPLLTLDLPAWEKDNCELCKAGIQLTIPGSSDKK